MRTKVAVPKHLKGLPKRLKALRLKRKLTQTELADIIGIPYFTILRLEGGINQPSYPILLALVRVLDTTTDYLLMGRKP